MLYTTVHYPQQDCTRRYGEVRDTGPTLLFSRTHKKYKKIRIKYTDIYKTGERAAHISCAVDI